MNVRFQIPMLYLPFNYPITKWQNCYTEFGKIILNKFWSEMLSLQRKHKQKVSTPMATLMLRVNSPQGGCLMYNFTNVANNTNVSL